MGSVAALEKESGKGAAPADQRQATAAPTNGATNAAAQTAPLSQRETKCQLEEIVVTGTHISGVAPVGAVVIVYTSEDANQSGAATVDQFARTMTDNFASVDTISNQYSNMRFSPTSLSNGTNTFQGAAFNLHGLGPTATLTLLNGQRLAPGGLDGSFTDISQIPLSAMDHIEVLPDGASAIYGADAVAGVVNIITRNDFKGSRAPFAMVARLKVERAKSLHRSFLANPGEPGIFSSAMNMMINRD